MRVNTWDVKVRSLTRVARKLARYEVHLVVVHVVR